MNFRDYSKKAVGLALCVVFILLAAVIPVNAGHIHYEYDELGRLTSVTYGNGVNNTYTYDSGGNMLQSTSKIVLTVLSTDPVTQQTEVPINKVIHINFNQTITAANNIDNISLKQGDDPVNIATSIADKTLSVQPNGILDISTIYTVYIPAGAVQNPDNEPNQELTFSFTTSANTLTVVTESAANVHQIGVILNGTISGLANEENCDQIKFQYKEQEGSEWIDTSIQSGSFGIGSFSDYITSLIPGTSYLYRAMAHNSLGWIPGEVQSLTAAEINPDLPARSWIDAPAAGAAICGAHYNVHGWYLDGAGVTNLEIKIDGTTVGQAVYGDQRLDVQAAYPDYNNANAGFHYTLDTTALSNGEHTLTVVETNTLNQTSSKEVTFNVENPGVLPARGWIDAPASGATISGANYNVQGWYLDGVGVSKIDIMLDGITVGQAVYGDQRLDVQAAYPDYNDANSGFHYTLDTTAFSNGEHTLTVVETNTLDQTSSKAVTFNIENPGVLPARSWIDAPASGATISGVNYNVHGWYLDGAGVSMIEIQVDGTTVGQAVYGDQRLDVQAAYPDYNNANSGFHYTLDTTALSNGEHTLTIVETNTLDQSSSRNITFNVSNSDALPAIGWIDVPALGATISGTNYNVHGWYLDGAGVSKVEIRIDGIILGEAVYGDSRPDVQTAYPEYNNGNSGFHYTLDTTALSNGEHTLIVVDTNILDQTSAKQVKFIVNN
jgi:YD repeat-containing protein